MNNGSGNNGMTDRVISYAQNREDIILSTYFHDVEKGFYVDVGANEPAHDSVTKYFYDRGWAGINIEPSRKLIKKLNNQRPLDTNLNIGISDGDTEVMFREYLVGDGLSTFSKAMQDEHKEQGRSVTEEFVEYPVKVKTLKSVFDKYKVEHIHFLKVDVEGYEYEVIASNDWKKYRPEMICIEANHVFNDWRPLLKEANYTLVFNDGLNEYYVASEASKRVSNARYVEMILGRPVISHEWNKALTELELENRKFSNSQESLVRQIYELRNYNDSLVAHLNQSKRIRYILKQLAVSTDAIITLYLSKIDSKRYRHPRVDLKLVESMDEAELIEYGKRIDMRSFSSGPRFGKIRHTIFITLQSVYLVVRAILFQALKVPYKLIRSVRQKPRSDNG